MNYNIPNPCHENWDDMNPDDKGRFCSVCSKNVVDFTTMTDEEVLNYFSAHKGEKVCGRIQKKWGAAMPEVVIQLPNRNIYTPKSFWKIFMLSLVLTFGVIVVGFKNYPVAKVSFEQKEEVHTTMGVIVIDIPPPETSVVVRSKDLFSIGIEEDAEESYPTFIAGEDALMEFFAEKISALNLKAYKDSLPRKVKVQTTIDTTGRPKNTIIIKGGLDGAFNRHIINIVNQMPVWEPGKINGKPLEMKVVIPIYIPKP